MTDDQRRQRQRLLQLRIREVAYMLWEASGRDHGRALDFWLAAEQEVLSELPAETQAKTRVEHGTSAQRNAGVEAPQENGGAEDAADG